MKHLAVAVLALAAFSACRSKPKVELPLSTPVPEKKPVVFVPPVETKPFEEGYRAGFELGRDQGSPGGKLPDAADIERLAREQASGRPDRNERWERGFAEGYTDGFRNVVTGQK